MMNLLTCLCTWSTRRTASQWCSTSTAWQSARRAALSGDAIPIDACWCGSHRRRPNKVWPKSLEKRPSREMIQLDCNRLARYRPNRASNSVHDPAIMALPNDPELVTLKSLYDDADKSYTAALAATAKARRKKHLARQQLYDYIFERGYCWVCELPLPECKCTGSRRRP